MEGEHASTASKYVRRRMKDGDLVEANPPRPARKGPRLGPRLGPPPSRRGVATSPGAVMREARFSRSARHCSSRSGGSFLPG
ncbi:MAG: hypothetical protein ACLFP6_05685 [Spirochaetaceae bacterium]